MCQKKDYAMLQYGNLKKEEIKEASELAARAYFDYIYITIFFPGVKERQRGLARFLAINRKGNYKEGHMLTARLFTNNRENLSFYTKRGYEVFHEYEIAYNGLTMGNWSLKKTL